MERARVAILAALLTVLTISGGVIAATSPGGALAPAAVSWPISTTLLLAELQTGGASASDEFVEVTNAGAQTADLAGLEVVYVTSTGGTVTRKATWAAARPLSPGQHLLIANTSGVFAGLADATYSGGFAATGGALVLRPVGGAPIDALAWGDATNAFVEGAAATAPAAGASIERLPGDLGGNTIDTNSNAADWFAQSTPNPQSLAAPPVPAPVPSATATPGPSETLSPTPGPTDTPSPTVTPLPSDSPTPSDGPSVEPSATVAPTATPEPSASVPPTPEPSVEPTATPAPTPAPTAPPTPEPTPSASPEPTATITPSPSPTPSPVVVPIAGARLLPDGAVVTIEGVLTTQLGALEAGRKGFVQDLTGGIAIYLDAAVVDPLPAGTVIRVAGTLDDRYAERTLRVGEADVVVTGDASLPAPILSVTGEVAEPFEGARVTVDGLTVGSPTALADGLGILVDDGTGAVRAILGSDALGAVALPAGTHVSVTGPVGQHDSSGTGTGSYRIHATLPGELVVVSDPAPSPPPAPSPSPTQGPTAAPSPDPTATLGPTPVPTANPSPSPTPDPTPSSTPSATATPGPTATAVPAPSPTPSPSQIAIQAARSAPVGSVVTVEGVVTSEPGRLGTPPLFAIGDGTGGIIVRLPDGAAAPGRGATVRVSGPTADPYGQLEIRPAAGGLRITGTGVVPAAKPVGVPELGESTEATLVQLLGTVQSAPTKGTSGDLVIDAVDAGGRAFRLTADASSGIRAADIPRNQALRFVGIVGQHASRKGALDGYRLWLRDRGDVFVLAGPAPSAGANGAGVVSIAAALAAPDGTVLSIEATVTAGISLLDSSGRRIVVQDGSGAIEVLLPTGAAGPAIGDRLRIEGEKAHAWGAPRLRATSVEASASALTVSPAARAAALAERDEWRLVRLSGTVLSVHRIGERWTAEIRLANGDRVPILGQAGAGIVSTAIVEGRAATIVGIVKRPYPTASDRRFALLPRGRSDLAIGPAAGPAGTATDSGDGTDGVAGRGAAPAVLAEVTPDTDLATLFEHIGQVVRVGGLVRELAADGFLLDDGTAVAKVVLHGDALVLLPHLEVGDALAASGVVQQRDEALEVSVASASDLVRVGDLGQALPVDSTVGATAGPSPDGRLQPAWLAGAGPLEVVPAEVSLATFGGVTLLSILVTVLRRRAAARRSRAIVLARLAALTGSHRR